MLRLAAFVGTSTADYRPPFAARRGSFALASFSIAIAAGRRGGLFGERLILAAWHTLAVQLVQMEWRRTGLAGELAGTEAGAARVVTGLAGGRRCIIIL